MTRCELHQAELEIHHYKHGDVARCSRGCVIQSPEAILGKTETKVRVACALEDCERPVLQDTGGRPGRFCSSRHRLRDWRLRRNSGDIKEVPQ